MPISGKAPYVPPPPPAPPQAPSWWMDLSTAMRKTVSTRLRVKGYDVTAWPK